MISDDSGSTAALLMSWCHASLGEGMKPFNEPFTPSEMLPQLLFAVVNCWFSVGPLFPEEPGDCTVIWLCATVDRWDVARPALCCAGADAAGEIADDAIPAGCTSTGDVALEESDSVCCSSLVATRVLATAAACSSDCLFSLAGAAASLCFALVDFREEATPGCAISVAEVWVESRGEVWAEVWADAARTGIKNGRKASNKGLRSNIYTPCICGCWDLRWVDALVVELAMAVSMPSRASCASFFGAQKLYRKKRKASSAPVSERCAKLWGVIGNHIGYQLHQSNPLRAKR
jgi:hypothetical protein